MNSESTSTIESVQPEAAKFVFRLFAHFIDAGVVGVFGNGIIALIRNSMGTLDAEDNLILISLTFLMSPLLMFFYSGYCYSQKGSSIGKIILGLEVQKLGDHSKLEFWRGGLRDSVGKTISFLVAGIGFLLILFRPDRRALHDLMFETEVRKVKPIKPVLVIAGLFTAILSFQLSQWNGSFLNLSGPSTQAPSVTPSMPVAPQSGN